MSIIQRVPWTVQPQYASKVQAKYRPLYGLQPGGFGRLDTSSVPLTAGSGVSSGVSRQGRIISLTDNTNGYLRNLAVSANYPLSFVFVGSMPSTGDFRCPSMLTTASDKTVRFFGKSDGSVVAQHIGGTTSATATSAQIFNFGEQFTAVAVFGSATDVRVYGAGTAGRSSASSSTNVGALVPLTRLAYGQYNGSVVLYPWGGNIALAQWLNVSLTAAEAWALVDNPWKIFAPLSRMIWAPSAGALATSIFDGKIIIKSSGTNLLDGKVQIKDVVTALLDGKVAIGSVQQSLLDGKLTVKDTAVSFLDGKVMVKDIATSLLDGKLEITQGGVGSDLLDGKIQIKDALTALVDGKVIVKSVATDLLDGKLTIGTSATGVFDGKVQIKDIATALLDGKIQVKNATVDLLDGKIIISDGVTSFSKNNQLLIDSIGGKVLQLGNTRINSWNTAGRPASPKTGTIGLNTQTVALDIYDGSNWKSVTLS